MTASSAFNDYLSVADALPSAPRVLPRLLSLLSDPDADVREIVDLIAFDPGLTSKLLRACNSAFIGLPEPAADVGEAVNRLGVSYIYKLTAAVCGAATFQSASSKAFASELWQHSVTSAFAAELMAADLGLNPGTLFTAALLHDIGKMVLAERWRESYWRLLEETRTNPFTLADCEQRLYRLSHGELGGRLLPRWKFPSPISSSVWLHHFPVAGVPFERETACVTLAEAMADTIVRKQETPALTAGQESALSLLELDHGQLGLYLSQTQENFQFVNALCQVGT